MKRKMGYCHVAIGLHVLMDLMTYVLSEIYCRQEQLGSTVVIKCPPQNKLDLNQCCNDNGKIVCCSHEDFTNRGNGQSVEVITLLAVAGFFTVLFVTVLCYIRWHSRFSKSSAASSSDKPTNYSQPFTLPKNKHQGMISSQQTSQRKIPNCRYAEVLKSILEEDEKGTISPTKEANK